MFRTSGESKSVTFTIKDNADSRISDLNTEVFIYNVDSEERDVQILELGGEISVTIEPGSGDSVGVSTVR